MRNWLKSRGARLDLVKLISGVHEKEISKNHVYLYLEPALVPRVRSLRPEGLI